MKRWLIVREQYDLSYFTEGELETANAFRLEKRREEWLLARFAAKKLAVEHGVVDDPRRCEVARPMLLVDGAPVTWFVSISHSAPYAAAILDRAPVGIDIQVTREIPATGARLYLREREIEEMQRCTIAHRMLHFWCAKEAAWKQRSDEFTTLRQVPLTLVEERANGLRFDVVETMVIEDAILGVTLPTS